MDSTHRLTSALARLTGTHGARRFGVRLVAAEADMSRARTHALSRRIGSLGWATWCEDTLEWVVKDNRTARIIYALDAHGYCIARRWTDEDAAAVGRDVEVQDIGDGYVRVAEVAL